jgi:RHS repeat-associated protein
MHYGADWRLLEERVDDAFILNDWNAGSYAASSIDRTEQHVWGLRYIDDAVLHRIDANKDGDYTDAGDGTWYHLTDAQFSSVCLVDPAGAVAERVSYSAYGIARHHWQGDVDGDGAVTVAGGTSDLGLVTAASGSSIGGAGYRAEYDLDRDGDVDSADQSRVGSATAALPAGQLSPVTASGPDSQAGWDGYLYAAETGLYAVRYRTYEPGLGRWFERDPRGYRESTSAYEYCISMPLDRLDPSGLLSTQELMQKIVEAGGLGGVSQSLNLPPIPIGTTGCAFNFVATFSGEERECRDGQSGTSSVKLCFAVDLEAYVSCGLASRSKQHEARQHERFRESPPGIKNPHSPGYLPTIQGQSAKGLRRAAELRNPSGYRQRSAYVGVEGPCPDDCPSSGCKYEGYSGSGFIRGTVGAYVGVQLSLTFSVDDFLSKSWDEIVSWDNLSGSGGVAYGVWGASIEGGVGLRFSACCKF